MRVLMVHDEPLDGGYGAEAYVRRLVAGLRAAGDEVDVLAGEVQHHGANRVRDVWDGGARDLVNTHAVEFGADVIHFHNIARELSGSVLGAAPHVPAVMTVHDFRLLGAYEHSLLGARGYVERAIATRVRRSAAKRLAATIGVSDHVSEALRLAGFPNVSTVRVPVAAPVTPPRPVADCHDVAVVARLAKDKGVDVAIDTFSALPVATAAGGRLRIAGDGPERSRLDRQIAALPQPDRVELLGRLDEPAVSALLSEARVVMVTSQPRHRPEGSSLAMVEAAMHGRPVVASADPAVKEVAATLGNALVATGWSIGHFMSEVERLFADDDLARQLGRRGKANAERLHSVAAVTAATRRIYQSVIA